MSHQPNKLHALLAGTLLLASSIALANGLPVASPAKELQHAKTYTVSSAPIEPLQIPAPTLPDLSGYTAEAVQDRKSVV